MENRAGFWIRFVAFFIDSLILSILEWIISLIFGGSMNGDMNVLTTLINLVLAIIYFVWFQTRNNGQTFGKKITGIRVAILDGGQVTFGKMALREIVGKTISTLILLIGFLLAAGRAKRALHDYIAGTIVIRTE